MLKPLFSTHDVQKEVFLKPSLAAVDALHASINISAHTGTTAITLQPDYPRNVTLTTVDAATNDLAGSVTVTGTNMRGEAQTEVFTIAINVDDYVGNKAFATVTSVAWNLPTSATSDTMTVGTGSKLGLSKAPVSVVKETFNGADRAVGTLNTTNYTYVTGATLDGAKAVEVIYRVKY
jgi:hypothetical protein